MPFDPDAYLAEKEAAAPSSGFDPDKYLAGIDAKDKARGYSDDTPESDTLTAGIRGGLDALTLSHMDEFGGAVKHPIGAAKALIGSGSDDPDVANYEAERDQWRQIYQRAKDEHPYAFGAGNIAGTLAGPGKLLKGLKGIKSVAAAGTLGGLAGEGMSDADLADKEYGRLAFDTAVGVGVGAGTQAIGNKIGDKIASSFAPRAADAVEGAVEGSAAKEGTRAQQWAKKIFGIRGQVENADEVAQSIKNVSGQDEVPEYLLSQDKPVKNLADTLLKSPTIGGAMTRREVMPIYEGLERFGKAVADRASNLTEYEAGTAVKKGAAERFANMIKPAEDIYEALETKFADVPLERTAFRRGINKLRDRYKTDLTGGSQKLLDQIEQTFGEVKDVADLRQFRTDLGKYLDGNVSQAQKDIVGRMYGVLTRERDRSILRGAVDTGPILARGGKSASMLRDLKKADKIYGNAVSSTADALGIEGSSKQSTSTAIRDYLQNTPSEQVVKDLFDKGDYSAILKVRDVFPDQFNILKERAISDLVARSSYNGEVSVQRLVSNLDKYQPEVRQLLLDDLTPQLGDVRKTLGALPKNFNPSDTSTRLEYLDLLSPRKNAQSLIQRQVLKRGAPKLSAMAANTEQARQRILQKAQGTPWGQSLGAAAQRGPEAFAATYYVLSTSYPGFRAMLDKDDEEPQSP